MRVLFWGTPEFAVPPLRALIGEGFEVCGVVTQPDKPVGRKRELQAPPVKTLTLQEKLPLYQPVNMKDAEFREAIELMAPDISVVVAYGHILPKAIIDLPGLGTLNIHASLLPALRGAAPIQEAIRAGHDETGVSIMQMVPALDAGPVILQKSTPILPDETYGELQNRLSELGAQSLIEALALISLGSASAVPQDETLATYAPKVDKDTARINWSQSARQIANMIRAYDPKPSANTTLNGVNVKLYGVAKVIDTHSNLAPGTVIRADTELHIQCGSGSISIAEVQPAGKKRMMPIDWIRGRGVSVGEYFT